MAAWVYEHILRVMEEAFSTGGKSLILADVNCTGAVVYEDGLLPCSLEVCSLLLGLVVITI